MCAIDAFDHQSVNSIDGVIDGLASNANCEVWRLWCFVWCVYACESAHLACTHFCIQAFRVTAFAFFDSG
jgi:hypothetical protein